MVETIIDLLAKQFRIDPATVDADTNIVEDLGADSLEIVDMLMAIEENFGITVSDEEALTLKTVKDVADFIEEKRCKLRQMSFFLFTDRYVLPVFLQVKV